VRLALFAAMSALPRLGNPRELTALREAREDDHNLAWNSRQGLHDWSANKTPGKEPSQRDVADSVPCARARSAKRLGMHKKW